MRKMSYGSDGTNVGGNIPMCPLSWWMFGEARASMDALELTKFQCHYPESKNDSSVVSP